MKFQDLDDTPAAPTTPAPVPEHRVVVPLDAVPPGWRRARHTTPGTESSATPSTPTHDQEPT